MSDKFDASKIVFGEPKVVHYKNESSGKPAKCYVVKIGYTRDDGSVDPLVIVRDRNGVIKTK